MAKKKKKMEFETMQVKLPHVKGLSIVLPVIYILWVAVMYYLLLPALNIPWEQLEKAIKILVEVAEG